MNRENLEKLAAYLESGDLKAAFDMNLYAETASNATLCGSLGCAIGHGPYAGIEKRSDENWLVYSNRVFDLLNRKDWNFLFSTGWTLTDNSPEGVARRIRWLLDGKSIEDYVTKFVPRESNIWYKLT